MGRSCKIIVLQTLKAFILLSLALIPSTAFCQDTCSNASIVPISNSGFGLGSTNSATIDISSATVQPGETFAPELLINGINQKSIWFKFTIPTTRAVSVRLLQPSVVIAAGDVGFAVYRTGNCLPTSADISTKLTPHTGFDSTFHPCVEPGEYLVQVSGKAAANGSVFISVRTAMTGAVYDQPVQAYNFALLPHGVTPSLNFTVDCHSIEDAGEICNVLGNFQDYNKSTWHVFTTAAYFDYVAVGLYNSTNVKCGIKLYQGDVRSTHYSTLPVVATCDSLVTLPGVNRTAKIFGCGELSPNTTYSIQLFYHKNFTGGIGLRMSMEGTGPTIGPVPILSAISPTTNNMGVLPSSPTGIGTSRNDKLACNSRHSLHPCNPSLPAAGVLYNGGRYNLSSFFMFTLSSTSTVTIGVGGGFGSPNGSCGPPLLGRLYNQSVSNSCNTLDTVNIIGTFRPGGFFRCLPAGNYTLQVMGQDTAEYAGDFCQKTNLGTAFSVNINVSTTIVSNRFNLSAPGAFDTLNNVAGMMQALVPGVVYTAKVDTFGCANTVLPLDLNCGGGYTKAIYREFNIADSGIVSLWSPNVTNSEFKIFKGDANALAISQGVFNFPATISGLTTQTLCIGGNAFPICDGQKACILPGTYTMVSYGTQNSIAVTNQMQARFDIVKTTHYNLATAEDMGDILSIIPPAGGSVTSSADYFSCKDNAIVIDGFQPCKEDYGIITSTKAIYRQFYLSRPASVSINSQNLICGIVPMTLFRGKATDGLAALTVMPSRWRCFANTSLNICEQLPAGWYTIVSYGWGASYENPTRDVNSLNGGYIHYGGLLGYGNRVHIAVTVSPCASPKYNRPYKAAIDTITNQPFLIQWAPRTGSTAAYPKTDTVYTLYPENFNCTNDSPFVNFSTPNPPGLSKVAFWVFRVTQESFVRINTGFPLAGEGGFDVYWVAVHAGNARTDSASFMTVPPIQPCVRSVGQIQLCKLQPGDYTLVVYTDERAYCQSLTPTIYIDAVGQSRFDHANNAYDFGLIPPDNVYHNGKPGDVNPLNSSRAPSDDFFYCTTGSQLNEPTYTCFTEYLPSIYAPGVNNPLYTVSGTNAQVMPRRSLWYTFTIDKGGTVKVKVVPKTPGKAYPMVSVYRSDVNGTIPFTSVVSSGAVDSTLAQGLTFVGTNRWHSL